MDLERLMADLTPSNGGVALRFGLADGQALTQIGDRFNISRERVQIERSPPTPQAQS